MPVGQPYVSRSQWTFSPVLVAVERIRLMMVELHIPVRMLRALPGFHIHPKRVALLLQEPAHQGVGHQKALFRQCGSEMTQAL